jgi:hypothetical protein
MPAYHHHLRPSAYRSFYAFVSLVRRRLFAVELGASGWKLTNRPRPCSYNEAGGVWLRRGNLKRWLAFAKSSPLDWGPTVAIFKPSTTPSIHMDPRYGQGTKNLD